MFSTQSSSAFSLDSIRRYWTVACNNNILRKMMHAVSVSSVRLGTQLQCFQSRRYSTMIRLGCLVGQGGSRRTPKLNRNRVWIGDASRVGPETSGWRSNQRSFSEKSPSEAKPSIGNEKVQQSLLQRFLSLKEMPEKYTFAWYREMVLICTVFAVTGSSTMFLVSSSLR